MTPAILLTGAGKRYDIVSCFAALTTTVVADPEPLAPARYAAHVRCTVPAMVDAAYVPALAEIVRRHDVGLVLPLTDLDIEILARAREAGELPALVPSSEVARATYDKYEAHLLLERHGLPTAPAILPGDDLDAFAYPAMVKPRRGSGARSIHRARDAGDARFLAGYIEEDVMVERAMNGPELSIDCLGDRDGRCLNAIPRTMLESRGGESIKGAVVDDRELVELGREVMEALAVRGPATIQVFRDPDVGIAITDVNTRFGGAFPAPIYAAHPGRSYPELIVRMAAGESVEPHVGEFDSGMTFTRYFWQLELDARLEPTGRDIVEDGPRPPGGVEEDLR
ncbi:MAG TPA: ATP-grasp domain-containing protein [Solirubrobacteraceae bacterium]|nr:ATP-grasp domain-containing protein [Solirubrobacteraceae bacterium]